ncbi:MAG: hypothetical protein ACE5LH_07105 [Fidelibacterota bacterium]
MPLILILLNSSAAAAVIRVPQNQPTIQAGIDAVSDGDTVLVDTGRYVENINFRGKNIIVGSLYLTTGDTSYVSRTIIDGDSSGSVVTFENGEDSTAVLTGFTLTNGLASWGGGIQCNLSSNPRLIGLNITGNYASGGAGLYCFESHPSVEDVTISGNTAQAIGGGVACTHSDPTLVNVSIRGNEANHGAACFARGPIPFLGT